MSEAMVPVMEESPASWEKEIAFLADGKEMPPLYLNAMPASEAAKCIVKFTETWPDPFSPSYPYSNAWANKKDNKGKKDRPPGPVKPAMAKGEVNL